MNLPAIVRAARKLAGRNVPPAGDNQPGRDRDALATCRGIADTDPHITRQINHYLRRKGEL